jgi:COP9 signalosome complex subunit 1
VAKERDLRAQVHKDVLEMARNYERAARLKLVRMNMIRAGLEIKAPKGPNFQGGNPAAQQFQDMRGASGRSQGFLERLG